MYTDTDFRADDDSIFWADLGESWSTGVNWGRLSELYPKNTLYG